ncbi:unnamed protein product [Didymodactylos carnosus]|uniref:FLYWCH-type domain-containing protein n=1 Tax=Didymodactylos carnosus TaxID=1234261 RepID=A0A815RVF9_9BILA|nr:unnamed protein product [Didymodactylos carnosus]CAF4347613.1 unnamed protein product [Didymodactylos carnosus]
MKCESKPLLVRDNYIYYVSKRTATFKYWKCEDRSGNASVHTNIKDAFIKTVSNHSLINETTAITKIYDEEFARQQMSQTAAAIIPSPYEANSGLNRARRKMTPVLPTSYVSDISAQYLVTLGDEQFLLCDKTLRNKRLLLFGTEQQLTFLFSAKHIMMDGTFDTCPPYLDQVYTIHAIKLLLMKEENINNINNISILKHCHQIQFYLLEFTTVKCFNNMKYLFLMTPNVKVLKVDNFSFCNIFSNIDKIIRHSIYQQHFNHINKLNITKISENNY